MKEKEEYIDFKRIFSALWQRIWAIILVGIICAGIAFGYTKFMVTPMYTSRTLMYVNNNDLSVGGSSFSISASNLAAAQSLVETYMVILNTRLTLNEVIDVSGVDYTYEQLSGMIDAKAINETEIFSVEVTSPNPKEAELIANTIGVVLPGRIAAVVEGSSVRVVDYAVEPAGPSSPSMTKNVAIGAFIGVLIVSAIIIVIEMMDELIHGSDYLMQNYDIPILAVIPELESASHIPADYHYHPSASKEKKGDMNHA